MRLEWSHDGNALLTCVAGTLRRHVGDASRILDGPSILDARWRADGAIVSIDSRNQLRRHEHGKTIALPRESSRELVHARIGTTEHCFAAGPRGTVIESFAGRTAWTLKRGELPSTAEHGLEASDDLRYIAVANGHLSGSWWIFDTRKDQVVDRHWIDTRPSLDHVKLAFDGTSKRIAVALTGEASVGAIRIDRSERYPRDHLGGASAVALDARGLLAAYAYPRGIGPRKLRVDYLARGVKGDTRIPIIDTLWIDPDLDDIIAVAFDRASRRIACLGASGTIEIVPVP